MGFLQILMNSASKSKNNLLCASHLSQLDSRKGSAFVEISLTRTHNSKIRWLHTRLKWIFFTNWSDNDVAEPFFWQQPAFLRDHYQPFTGSRHFATYIQALQPRFHKTHHAARTLNLSPHAKKKQNRTPSTSFFYLRAVFRPAPWLTERLEEATMNTVPRMELAGKIHDTCTPDLALYCLLKMNL